MKVSSKNVLGALAAAFVAGGLLSACSSKPTADGGSSSSSSSSGSSTCGAAASVCTVTSECCTGLTCTGGSCTAQCGAAGDSCSAAATCCSPLVCDSTSNTCLTGNSSSSSSGGSSACPPSPALGGCITAANCAPPDLCLPASDGGGYCGAVTTQPSAICTPNGQTCTATTVCCGGSCVGGKCAARTACGVLGQGCNVAGDCCNNFKCVQGAGADNGDGGEDDAGLDAGATDGGSAVTDAGTGTDGGTAGTDAGTTPDSGTPPACTTLDAGTFTGTCQPSCGGYLDTCSTTNGNADCCQEEGWTCLSLDGGTTVGVCYPVAFQDSSGNPVYCGGPCSNLQCQLSAPCDTTATTDACASAGLTCDQQFGVCRDPAEGDPCLPGGPSCEPLANSTVTDIQCLPDPSKFGGANAGYACFQPCALTDPGTGSNDCVDPLMTCIAVAGAGSGAECFFNEAASCATPFGPCDSAGVGDGVCVPYNFSNGTAGLCFQATLTGGTPGSPCNFNDNRQNGGFCDPTSYCLYGTCEANCNAGTGGKPGCAQDAGAGATVGCADLFGQGVGGKTPAATAFGVCSVNCDFTSPTGGGCTTVDCAPEKCLPPAYFGFTDGPTGICVEAPATSPAVGQPCSQSQTVVDTCGEGAMCLGNGIDLPFTCVQLCTNVSSAGAPCVTGESCYPLDFGTALAHEGYCSIDGGVGPGLNGG